MGRTYIPDCPTWICDVLFGDSDTMTINVCANLPQEAADAAMIQAVTDLGNNHGVKACFVYPAVAATQMALNAPYMPDKHKPRPTNQHKLRVVK